MREFVDSLKSDLLDKRFLPVLAVLGVALLAALGYAIFGGGGSSTSSTPPAPVGASSAATGATGAIAISQAPTGSDKAVAETTSGASKQHAGKPRNPFTPLPSTKAKSAANASPSTPASGSSSGGSSSSSSSGSASTPSSGGGTSSSGTTPKPAKPKGPQKVYKVDVLFGVAPAGTPLPNIPTAAFDNLTRLYPLTADGEAPLVFAGVTAGGAGAIFTVVREVILNGPAVCRPSASQCQAIQLKPGQSEELQYVSPSGEGLVYKLELVSIKSVTASAAKAARAFHAESRAGRALLRHAGLSALPGLRYSLARGIVVVAPGGHRAFGARVARHR